MLCTLLPWIIGLGSALIGGLIGWYLFRNRKWLPYQHTIDEQTADYDTLNTSYNTLNAKYTTTQANLVELQNSHLQWESRYHTLNYDHLALSSAKRSLETDFDTYKAEVEKTEAALQAHLIEMDALVKQRATYWEAKLAQSNEQLTLSEVKLKAQNLKSAEFDNHFDDLQHKHDALLEESRGYISQIPNLKNAVEDLTADLNFEKQRVAALEASDKESQTTIQGLESHVSDLKTQHLTLQVAHSDLNYLVTALNTAHASEKQSWESQSTTLTNSHTALVAEHETKSAQLSFLRSENEKIITHLSSITNQLGDWERKYYDVQKQNEKLQHDLIAHHKTAEHLHETRVHLHALQEELASINKQLASSNSKLETQSSQLETWESEKKEYEGHVEKLMEEIQVYHSKAAEHLDETRAHLHGMQTRVSNYELLVADLEAELARLKEGGKTLFIEAPFETIPQVQQRDKLEIVEGIGPKIVELLNAAGIYTFMQLSEVSFERLKNILNEAGPRFRMHDPHTWPSQAAMAHKGDWDELKVYQSHLKGGRENG